MKETIDTIIKWHTETFPEATLDGQLEKFEEEKKEYNIAPYGTEESLYELADMVIVSAGVARFDYTHGIDLLSNTLYTAEIPIDDIWEAVQKKMEKNRKRVWNKTGNGTYHHENGIED